MKFQHYLIKHLVSNILFFFHFSLILHLAINITVDSFDFLTNSMENINSYFQTACLQLHSLPDVFYIFLI